jgi:hypothetical protein
MFVFGIFSWWYGAGWRGRALRLREGITGTMDYFSIDLLIGTLFAPFRQISAGKTTGSLDVQLHAFFDRLISRCIGAVMRIFMVVVGTIAIILHAVIGGLFLVTWAVIPLLPVIGVMLFVVGWIPWKF